MEGKCPICDEKAAQKCSNCHLIYYCSKEHQKQHWKSHKSNCRPVTVKQDAALGRYLITSKDIKEGHIVFKEKPLIVGPAQVTPPVCLGCCKLLTEREAQPCERCGWPVCSQYCQESPQHRPECFYTVQRGGKVHIKTFEIPHPNYQCITIVRCLYQKKAQPQIWKRLVALESHCEHRKGTEKWSSDHIQIAQFIRRFFKLESDFSEDEIMKICGIIQVNGHEVPLTDPPHVAVYDITSMVEHNCKANCSKTFSVHGEIMTVAAVPITAGGHLSICYTDPLWGTASRRHHLAMTKFFQCRCERCRDPTELGTMFSALKCRKEDCHGYVLPKSFIESDDQNLQKDELNKACNKLNINDTQNEKVNPKSEKQSSIDTNSSDTITNENDKILIQLDAQHKKQITSDNDIRVESKTANSSPTDKVETKSINLKDEVKGKETIDKVDSADTRTTNWFCNKCAAPVTEHSVLKLMEHIGKDLNAMKKGSVDCCLRFTHHYGKFLHPHHYYMTDVSLALAQLIGQEEEGGLQVVSDERLELKVDVCRQIADFLEKLVPAETRARGGLMFELHAALAETGRRRAARTGEGPGILIRYLQDSKKILEKSIHLLQHEPENIAEGKICTQAKLNLADMEAVLQNLYAQELPMSL